MKRKFKVTLVVFLVVILGCFSQAFAATNVNTKSEKNVQISMNKNLLDSATDDGAVVGTSNFNGTAENSANIDDKLFKPEVGWKRYDDSSKYFSYIGKWGLGIINLGDYGNTVHWTTTINSECKFRFRGTKLRILTRNGSANRSNKVLVTIDGNAQSIDESKNNIICALEFNVSGLSNTNHNVSIKNTDGKYVYIDAIDIDSTGYLIDPSAIIAEELTLNKTTDSLTVGQTDTLTATVNPDNATNKTVTWSTSDASIATVDSNGKITALKAGAATITATTQDGSNLSASCAVNVNDPLILNIEPEKTKINLNDTVSADLTIDNIQDIAAEDIRIKYDSTKLNFLGYDEVDGIKLVKDVSKDGELRVIIASKGKANIINAKKILLKLKFKGIAVGDALVDVIKGRVSDGITKEWDLTDAQCGQATITIQKMGDVDNSGEYTLLDLGIDARHMGEDPSTLPQYNTDQDGNNTIDDTDLTEIGKYILENPSYALNNIK